MTFGSSIQLPGAAALAPNGGQITVVSCSSSGNCAAGGIYSEGAKQQALVASEKSGVWRPAIQAPGTGLLNSGGPALMSAISCASGSCVAGGGYQDISGNRHGFVVESGVWGGAIEEPAPSTLGLGISAGITALSCPSSGNCAAGGYYYGGTGAQAFVVNEKNWVWGTPIELPGAAALNLAGLATVTSIACATAGNCAAGGHYVDAANHTQAFVASEKKGVWGTAVEAPGTAALNLGGSAWPTTVSCGGVGNCSAGGYYVDGSGHEQAFVLREASGAWKKAKEVPGTGALNLGGTAQLRSISCRSLDSCTAAGYYTDGSSHEQPFVVVEKLGVWKTAIVVPGAAALNVGGHALLNSVSCASPGNCLAGGRYVDADSLQQAFVVSQTDGTWGSASQLPGVASSANAGSAAVQSIACASSGKCVVGGYYTDGAQKTQPFVTP